MTTVGLSSIQQALIRRQQREIIECNAAPRTSLYRLAARMLLPRGETLAFNTPFPPVGKVLLLLLSRRPIADGDLQRDQVYFRGYVGRYDRPTGVTQWDVSTSRFAYDLGLLVRQYPEPPSHVMSASNIRMLQAAVDMNRACARAASHSLRFTGRAVLPPTLLAIPRGFRLEPESTPFVAIRATIDKISINDAWHKLAAYMRVPAEATGMDADLIDSRIIHEQACLSLAEHHDLRALLGRATFNPARNLEQVDGTSQRRLLWYLRSRMRPDMAAACTDDDVLQAASEPKNPLIATRVAPIQVWRPAVTPHPAAAYQFEEAGVKADLWNTEATWINETKPYVLRGTGMPRPRSLVACA